MEAGERESDVPQEMQDDVCNVNTNAFVGESPKTKNWR